MLGIDPGLRNYGVAVLEGDVLLFSGVYNLGATDNVPAIQSLLAVLDNLVRQLHPDSAAIEYQHGTRALRGIQQASVGALWALGVNTTIVQPQTLKRHFGLGFHGHDENKIRAMKYVTETLGYGVQTDHEADAILLALWRMKQY